METLDKYSMIDEAEKQMEEWESEDHTNAKKQLKGVVELKSDLEVPADIAKLDISEPKLKETVRTMPKVVDTKKKKNKGSLF